MITLLLL